MEQVLCLVKTQFIYSFNEYTYTFVMHTMFDILVFDVIVNNMQVLCRCVSFDVLEWYTQVFVFYMLQSQVDGSIEFVVITVKQFIRSYV